LNKKEIRELIATSNHLFVDTSRFTKSLGLRVEAMSEDESSMVFHNSPDLTGSERTTNLHGGVIASVMDVTGSLVVFSNLVFRMKGGTLQERIARVTRITTIDLRIDYIRPGNGTNFKVTAHLLRTGRTVAVSRIELFNEAGLLLAAGTASYLISVK